MRKYCTPEYTLFYTNCENTHKLYILLVMSINNYMSLCQNIRRSYNSIKSNTKLFIIYCYKLLISTFFSMTLYAYMYVQPAYFV